MKIKSALVPNAGTMRSEAVGKILSVTLWSSLGYGIVTLLIALIGAIDPSVAMPLQPLMQELVSIGLLAASVILFAIWMFQLHDDLRHAFGNYPITPALALAQLFVPLYNLWGIWNVYSTMNKTLRDEGGDLAEWGRAIRSWLPWLYGTLIVSNLLVIALSNAEQWAGPAYGGFVALANTIICMRVFVWIHLVRLVRSMMQDIAMYETVEFVEVELEHEHQEDLVAEGW